MTERNLTEKKREWLLSWAEEHPEAVTREAHEALRNEFGETLNNKVVSDILRSSRSRMFSRAKTIGALPELAKTSNGGFLTTETIKSLGETMKRLGIKRIEISPEGEALFVLA